MSSPKMEQIIDLARAFVKEYMSTWDPSHDYTHILRVLHTARTIEASMRELHPEIIIDSNVVTLGAMLHDVGDRKYVQATENAAALVQEKLIELGADKELAKKVQTICTNVSYNAETKSKASQEAVAKLCLEIPELAIVQDADRLDSIGATGIARLFAFSGAKCQERGLSIDHFYEKLIKLVDLMKTEPGKKLAQEQTDRLNTFLGWWAIETKDVEGLAEEEDVLRSAEAKKWAEEAERKKILANGVTTKLEADLDAEDAKWAQETGAKKVDDSV